MKVYLREKYCAICSKRLDKINKKLVISVDKPDLIKRLNKMKRFTNVIKESVLVCKICINKSNRLEKTNDENNEIDKQHEIEDNELDNSPIISEKVIVDDELPEFDDGLVHDHKKKIN